MLLSRRWKRKLTPLLAAHKKTIKAKKIPATQVTVEDTGALKESEEKGLDGKLNGETVEIKENVTTSDEQGTSVDQKPEKETEDGIHEDVGKEKAADDHNQGLSRDDVEASQKEDEKKSESNVNDNTDETEEVVKNGQPGEKVDNLQASKES
eukprot:jgi/Bigna1/130113/aug1.10_g4821